MTNELNELGMVPIDLYQVLGFDDNERPYPFNKYINTAHNAVPHLFEIKGGFNVFEILNIRSDKIQEVLKNLAQKNGLKTDITYEL